MVLLILIKELKILIKDKTAVMILLVMPIILLTILGLALQGSFYSSEWTDPIHIAVVREYADHDPAGLLREAAPNDMAYRGILAGLGDHLADMDPDSWFFDDFMADEQVSKMISWEIMDKASARAALDGGEVSSVVVLPDNFARGILSGLFFDSGDTVGIQVVSHNQNRMSYKIVRALMNAFASRVSDDAIRQKLLMGIVQNGAAAGDAGEFPGSAEIAKIGITVESLYKRPALSSFQYYSAAILAMFLFYGAGFAGTRLLDEMKDNTYQRQVAARIRPWQILAANSLFGAVISVLQMLIVMLFSRLALGVSWGNLWVAAAGVFGAAAAMGGINLFLSVITVRTENYQVINGFRNILIHIFALLGGSYLPLEMLPKILQKLSFFTLNGLAIKTWTKGMQLYTIGEILPLLGGLLAFAAGFAAAGLLLYPWREGARRV